MRDLDRQALVLLADDVEAEHHVIPLCMCFAALVRNALENLVLLRQMQRIRSYYRTLVPEADQFFGPAAEEERFSAAMATVGLRARPAGMLFTRASVIPAINGVVDGVGLALPVAKVASLATGAALAVGTAAAVVLFGLHLLYQQQRAASKVLRPPTEASSA
jgi:hypothetical protein